MIALQSLQAAGGGGNFGRGGKIPNQRGLSYGWGDRQGRRQVCTQSNLDGQVTHAVNYTLAYFAFLFSYLSVANSIARP